MTSSLDTSTNPDHKSYLDFLDSVGLNPEDMQRALESVPTPRAETGVRAYIAHSDIHGYGLFASSNVDGLVGKFKDKDGWYVPGRYTNHSCNPNASVFCVGDTAFLAATAAKDEEITVDYAQVKEALSNPHRVLVVDDFCDNVDVVVSSAYASGFGTWRPNKGEVGSSVYEGMNFWGNHATMLRSLSLHFGGVVVPNSMFFRATNVGMEKAYIHSDRETGAYTCVAYLSDHDTPSGTAFYRHRRTGLVEMPSFQEMHAMGIFEELKEDMVSRDADKWDLLTFVEGKYNRAVIFDAPLFHSRYPVEGIGTTPEDGRLIWASHFYTMDGHGRLF